MIFCYSNSIQFNSITDLNNFHWIDTFWWFLSNEASHSSILYIQTRMLLTCYLQQMHKGFIHQHILLRYKYPKEEGIKITIIYLSSSGTGKTPSFLI